MEMITGQEMYPLYQTYMRELMRKLKAESQDHESINQAARDSIGGGVYKYVYNVYTPTSYNRRYEDGGLADDNNIETIKAVISGHSVIITFEDRTPENGDGKIIADPAFYVSDIVESGHYGPRWPSPLYDTQWARPYLDNGLTDGAAPGQIIDLAIRDAANGVTFSW